MFAARSRGKVLFFAWTSIQIIRTPASPPLWTAVEKKVDLQEYVYKTDLEAGFSADSLRDAMYIYPESPYATGKH
ncbi:uncharacterized protein BKA78DRAFT_12318 [Phyllosticta capitalensis]|uniref:uncharacterized protein n=1 Tax=Phyllosticta capitalensis TaxID=121624 RepID=UPI003131D64D